MKIAGSSCLAAKRLKTSHVHAIPNEEKLILRTPSDVTIFAANNAPFHSAQYGEGIALIKEKWEMLVGEMGDEGGSSILRVRTDCAFIRTILH